MDANVHITPLPRNMNFYDINEDGRISLNEFARTLGHNPNDLHASVAFRTADFNGDGFVDFREFQTTDAWLFDDLVVSQPQHRQAPMRQHVARHTKSFIKHTSDSDEIDDNSGHDDHDSNESDESRELIAIHLMQNGVNSSAKKTVAHVQTHSDEYDSTEELEQDSMESISYDDDESNELDNSHETTNIHSAGSLLEGQGHTKGNHVKSSEEMDDISSIELDDSNEIQTTNIHPTGGLIGQGHMKEIHVKSSEEMDDISSVHDIHEDSHSMEDVDDDIHSKEATSDRIHSEEDVDDDFQSADEEIKFNSKANANKRGHMVNVVSRKDNSESVEEREPLEHYDKDSREIDDNSDEHVKKHPKIIIAKHN